MSRQSYGTFSPSIPLNEISPSEQKRMQLKRALQELYHRNDDIVADLELLQRRADLLKMQEPSEQRAQAIAELTREFLPIQENLDRVKQAIQDKREELQALENSSEGYQASFS